jgi:hypothetical protein
MPLAHATHWLTSVLYAAPVVVVVVGLWWQSRGAGPATDNPDDEGGPA